MRFRNILLLSLLILSPIVIYAQNKQHTVVKGDSFESIAQQYGISVDELRQANTRIKDCVVGFKLTIPQKSLSAKAEYDVSGNKAPSQPKGTKQSDSSQQNAKATGLVSDISISPASYPPESVEDYEHWKKNYGKEASKALVRSALAGYPEAMKDYAHELRYGNSKGIKKNKKESAVWYYRAARAGNSEAMWLISIYGDEKEFGSLSWSQKNDWLTKAMEYGNASATSAVASNYSEGRNGYTLDLSKAAELYDKASQLGRIYVKYDEFGKCAKYLPGSTTQALEKAKKYESEGKEQRAALWYFKAAENGNANAMLKMGEACEKQLFMECYNRPFEWYKKSAEAGNADGMYKLAQLYSKGQHGATMNKGTALDWFKKSYQAGNNNAIMNIADYYRYGYGVNKNLEEAKKWYTLAEKKNIDGASDHLRSVNRSIQSEAESKARQQQNAASSLNAKTKSNQSVSNNGASSSNDDWNTKLNRVTNSLNNLSESLINFDNILNGRGGNINTGSSETSMNEIIPNDISESEKQKIKEKNKETLRKYWQDRYDHAIKTLRRCYDTYAKFHKRDIKNLVKEYKEDGKFSQILIGGANSRYRDYMKSFREDKTLVRNLFKYAEEGGHKLPKHADHDLKFDFQPPLEAARAHLEREGCWHGW